MYHLEKKIESQGENITLNNTAKTPFEVFKVTGNSVQESRSGKNFFDVSKDLTSANTDYEYTHLDNGYRIKLTQATSEARYMVYSGQIHLEPGRYIFSCLLTVSGGTKSYRGRVRIYNSSGTIIYPASSNVDCSDELKYASFNIEVATDITIAFYYVSNSTIEITENANIYCEWKNIQLEKSNQTQPTEYEDYGVSPSPEYPSEIENLSGDIEITVCNKNLFDGIFEKGTIDNQGNLVATSNVIRTKNYIVANGTIVISYEKAVDILVYAYDSDKKYITNVDKQTTTTSGLEKASLYNLPEKTRYIKFRFNSRYTDLSTKAQVEKSGTATDYIEHEEQKITFPLSEEQKLMKGDYLADDGIHHKRKQFEVDGTNLKVNGVYEYTNGLYYCTVTIPFTSINKSQIYSTHFKWSKLGIVEINGCYVTGDGRILVFILEDQSITTSEGANNWLAQQKEAGTPVKFECELAEEEIDPYTEAQQEAYNQINSLYSYDEVTNIFSNNEISPIFDVSTFKMITEEFKQRLLNGKITRAYLKVLATDTQSEFTIDENNYLKDLTFEELRYIPEEGFIGGTVAKRVTGNFNNIDNSFSIQDREFELYMGVDLEDETTEYIKYGTYIVQKPEDDQVNDNTSFEALDYMIKLNLPWVDRMTYPCTLKELFDDLVAQSGLSTKVTSFLNQNFIVENNQFEEGTTRRDVLKAIAQMAFNWARIDEDNDIVMDFEKKDEVAEKLTADNYYNFKKQDMYGPINVIVLRNSQVEGENITIRDEESIAQYGETELVISDNPFAYTQAKRAELIEAGRILFGLTYIPMSMDMIGYMYLNCKDKIRTINFNNEKFDTYLLNHTIEYNGVINDSIEAPASTKTETKYQFTSDIIKTLKRTEIIVDKANQQIQQIVEEQTDFSNKISNIIIGLDGITEEVHRLYDFYKEIEDINEIKLEDCLPTSIVEFKAFPSLVSDILYPSKNLYPSTNLFPTKAGDAVTVVFAGRTRYAEGEMIYPSKEKYPKEDLFPIGDSSTKEFEFYFGEPLRIYNNIYDEFNIIFNEETGICEAKVIRRLKYENGKYIVLDIPEEQHIADVTMELFKGNNYVYLKEYKNWRIYAKYIFNNELNKEFAPRVETRSEVRKTADEINLEVSKKVNQDEVIASINLSPEEIKILAKNLQLEGFTSINGNFTIDEEGNMICNNATIKGTTIANGENFSVDEEGNMTCKSATMKNVICENFTIKNSTIQEGYIELKSTNGNSSFSVIDTSTDRLNSELSANLLNFNSNLDRGVAQIGVDMASGYGFVSVEGNVYANNISSDERLKENIIDSNISAIETLNKIEIKSFDLKKSKEHIDFGIIAQQVEKINENFVLKKPKFNENKEIIDYQYYINELPIISTLIKAIQEQQKQIENIKGGK